MMSRVNPSLGAVIVAMALGACTNMTSCVGCNPPAPQWLNYRDYPGRFGSQLLGSSLTDPSKVKTLHVVPGWAFTPAEGGAFRASPIVFNKAVFVGTTNGYFYAIDAGSGHQLWKFPPTGPALNGTCTQGGNGSWGQYGIQSSASYLSIGGQDAVVFGAPDPDPGTDGGVGSARLWALNASSGALIWKSDVVAHVNCSASSQLHERITYSSPLVAFGNVYVGVHDAGDDPVQKGKVMAVDANKGHLTSFSFVAVGSTKDTLIGGGVWNSPATDGRAVLFTTGNICEVYGCPEPEPSPDYSLSLVSVDPATGASNWSFRAVPFSLDKDPDWSAGPAMMLTSCGELVGSVEKDGWVYALDSSSGSCKWQFPPTAGPGCVFSPGDTHRHGDDDYKQPGASWGDELIIKAGGEALVTDGVVAGYTRMHALDACAPDEAHRVRWIVDVPHASPGNGYAIGAPTVTGGIVYVTTDQGHVVAFADPSVLGAPAPGFRCSSIDFGPPSPTWASDCTAAGYVIVQAPQVIADVALPDGSDAAGLRGEAAIALGGLFVGTAAGHLYKLEP
jgi:outer membrane protein assembly factor BamB